MLIDEIDLHLHPSLQAQVVQGLTQAFPNLQFIVTTHAPRVMSGLENTSKDQVMILRKEAEGTISVQPFQTFGLDINSIFALLGISIRDTETQKEIEELFRLVDEGKNNEARTKIKELRHRYGDSIPDITEAETLLVINS